MPDFALSPANSEKPAKGLPFSLQNNPWWAGASFVFLTAAVCHLLFSRLGFNLADEGFILAGARRILDGQVPHLDFISIRPAGSHILWAPLVALGGDCTIWISRFAPWMQFAAIAWIWALLFERAIKIRVSIFLKIAIGLAGFLLSVNGFPIMPWHTLDAIFFSSLGAFLCASSSNGRRLAGFLLVGAAPLFRLNFLPMILACLILFDGWRRPRFWAAAIAPSAAYVIYLCVNGAFADAVIQLGAYTNFFQAGVERYLLSSWFLAGLGIGLAFAVSSYSRRRAVRVLGSFGLLAIQFFFVFGLFVSASTEIPGIFYDWSFLAFGSAAGLSILLLLKSVLAKKVQPAFAVSAAALAAAWCSSISIGANSPCLMMGQLCTGLSFFSIATISRSNGTEEAARNSGALKAAAAVAIACLLLSSAAVFVFVRQNSIYCDMPASELDCALDGVFPGADMIKTNRVTCSILLDLEEAKEIARAAGKKYCILPDCAANWISDPQQNPLCVDWPQWIELGNDALLERAKDNISEQRGGLSIIVQKFMATDWRNIYLEPDWIPAPLPSVDYPIVQYVLENFNKTAETEYFEIYE